MLPFARGRTDVRCTPQRNLRLGAMTTAILVNWGLRRDRRGAYSLPLLLEAALLLAFGLLGAGLRLQTALLVPVTVLLLCYMMGLHNAVITKSSAVRGPETP